MAHQEQLFELTESYLKTLISADIDTLEADFDSFAPFGELGLDSFHVLKIIKKLEADFGPLSKTLLFENFNINDLAHYLVNQYDHILSSKFEIELPSPDEKTKSWVKKPVAEGASALNGVPSGAASGTSEERNNNALPAKQAVLVLEKAALAHPELGGLIQDLFDRYKNEGSVSRGTRNIAPNLFIGSERRGYFNYSRFNNVILVYAYTGPKEYFIELAKEMQRHCDKKGFEFNIVIDEELTAVGDIPFSATPFSTVQRIQDLQGFTLQGNKMRRLRYQVAKFEKEGKCKTEEYHCGSDGKIDRHIVEIIDEWCVSRTMVNPLIYIARNEILEGTFSSEHRVFLTYLNDVLQNVIIISPLSGEQNGYLMDLEFYGRNMPLGGLEFAIVKIIDILIAEGRTMFSLGLTLGTQLASSPNSDPEVEKILDKLREKNIFNDHGNLQFKNKFRPENKTVYLCRPKEKSNADNVIDIIMMIADPDNMQTPDEENHTILRQQTAVVQAVDDHANKTGGNRASEVLQAAEPSEPSRLVIDTEPRSITLADNDYNPLNINCEDVEYDLKTDSWALLKMPAIDKQMDRLHALLQQPAELDENLKSIFPFEHSILASSGRDAERILGKAWPKKGVVLQNLLFPTTIFHQIDNNFIPCELPHSQVFDLHSKHVFKGNLDFDALEKQVSENAESIAYVCIEVDDNAAGGCPVSMRHLKKVKSLLAGYGIALVIDGARILENARFIIEHEKEYAGLDIWTVVREICSQADVVIASLTKDFCVNKGGLIATNDTDLYRRLKTVIQEEGNGLDVIDRKCIALAMRHHTLIDSLVQQKMEGVKLVWQALKQHNIPVVAPVGGHCILIDAKRTAKFKDFENSAASLAAWMYLNTGIRGSVHNAGMQKNTSINGLVRLAVPIGLKKDQIHAIIDRLVHLFERMRNIPEVVMADDSISVLGNEHTRFKLKAYHQVDGKAISKDMLPMSEPEAPGEFQNTPPSNAARQKNNPKTISAGNPGQSDRSRDVAIVGMAGRYPKAGNLYQLWENLVMARDCVDDLPLERLERRSKYSTAERYRGGFLKDIDRFDPLFFNISPREAEIMDPQERLFLEVAWEAIEDAGYYPEILAQEDKNRNIGVYVGAVWTMYQMLGVEEKRRGNIVYPNSFLWSIANRVSYWMNFSGPSLTMDTACSSSLTALYLACEAIYKQECSGALVGGINLDLHQHKFDINSAGGAISKDGICRSFGKGANGYVAGEGVGAIFLKPLDQAVKDGDQIYGVIKSVAVNHGGRTSGYIVPNPKAQSRLIEAALEKAGIDARTIGYIEAHGTGTELGDPIEIAGLNSAFKKYQVADKSCAIGSVKTNIGHLEAAAGIVGVCKVLLQMQHRQLVPSLHSRELNSHIDFENSPFYVQQELESWNAKEVDGVVYPLRAGISSYGAGGANAHVIVEGYMPQAPAEKKTALPGKQIFPLSARNEEQLQKAALQLNQFLQRDLSEEVAAVRHELQDIAYTLQVGRKSFDCRLAIIAESKAELVELLGKFIEKKKDENILHGDIKAGSGIAKLLNRKEKKEFMQLLARGRDTRKFAQVWIEGLLSDWQGFQNAGDGKRVTLPTYPFADERYWIGTTDTIPLETGQLSVNTAQTHVLHPFLHANTSDFYHQRYRTVFSGDESFLKDHLINRLPVLSAGSFLEAARAAVENAMPKLPESMTDIVLKNIVWEKPLVVEGRTSITTVLYETGGRQIEFEIYSPDADEETLHCHGKAEFVGHSPAVPLNLAKLQAQMQTDPLDLKEFYGALAGMGVHYGKSFQCIKAIYPGDNQQLVQLVAPDGSEPGPNGLVLSPGVIDGAYHAAIGLIRDLRQTPGRPLLPAAVDSMQILKPCTKEMFAWVHGSGRLDGNNGGRQSDGSSQKVDIDLCDANGDICALIRGVSFVCMPVTASTTAGDVGTLMPSVDIPETTGEKTAGDAAEEDSQELFFQEFWREDPVAPDESYSHNKQLVLFTDEQFGEQIAKSKVAAQFAGSVFVYQGEKFQQISERVFKCRYNNRSDLQRIFDALSMPPDQTVALMYAWARGRQAAGIYALFELFTAVKASALPVTNVTLAGYYDQHAIDACWDHAWIGFERSLAMLLPRVRITLLYSNRETFTPSQFADALRHRGVIWHKDRQRYTLSLKPVEINRVSTGPVLKQNGGYLITGGCGALGFRFARFLAEQYNARLVLMGRRAMNEAIEQKVKALKKAGAREVHYVSTDIGSKEAMAQWAGKLPFPLSGVIHAAGVESVTPFYDKSVDDINRVILPKTIGTVLLDQLLARHPLDFVCYFSSTSAILGDGGPCDYAVANRFQMAYARYRQQQKHRGHTTVVNWPLWRDGGMGIDDPKKLEFYLKSSGQDLLQTDTGIGIWHAILNENLVQAMVMIGKPKRLTNALERIYEVAAEQPSPAGAQCPSSPAGKGWRPEYKALTQRQCIVADIKDLISTFLKIAVGKLNESTILTDYGFDSIGLAEFADRLTHHFGIQVTPDAFFNYTNIGELSEYFLEDHQAHIEAFYLKPETAGDQGRPQIPNETLNTEKTDLQKSVRERPSFLSRKSGGRRPPRTEDPIAIVGMAGRFPKAGSVEALWAMLEKAENGVSEIPSSRWDWRDYFRGPGDEKNTISTNKGGFIDGIDEFDPLFFDFTPEEAAATDPGQRLLLMEAYHAIEDAGIDPASLRGTKVGLFVGMEESQYDLLANNLHNPMAMATSGNAMISSRLSYFLDLHGPTIAINTACSSGLVALHQAAASIRQNECEAALVAGIALILTPMSYIGMSQAGMLSPDGRCYSLGNVAGGMGIGEAVSVLLLKPLSAAVANGDNIYGTIRASGINFDGRTNGITAPNGKMQAELIDTVYTEQRINANDITHIITHTTGTKLGDSIEMNAMNKAFRRLLDKQPADAEPRPGCAVTSCKGNLGHTLAASGLVSVISLLKAMQHRKIPASINCDEENDYITWKGSPFFINKATREWKKNGDKPLLGATSAFGRSGTNVHVVLEEYVPPEETRHADAGVAQDAGIIIPLSARTKEQLEQKAKDLLGYIEMKKTAADSGGHPADASATGDLAALAYTLQAGREAMAERTGFLVNSLGQLAERLQAYIGGMRSIEGCFEGNIQQYKEDLSILREDNDVKETIINKWIAQGNHTRLLDVWVKGLDFDWDKLYADAKPRRISLPAYPFARERYWINREGAIPKAVDVSPDVPGAATQNNIPKAQPDDNAKTESAMVAIDTYEFSLEDNNGGRSSDGMHLSPEQKAEIFVKQLFADQLQVMTDDIDIDRHLMDIGISSLNMAQITLTIKDIIDSSFTPTAFFECTTTKSFCDLLAETYTPVFEKIIVTKKTIQGARTKPEPAAAQGQTARTDRSAKTGTLDTAQTPSESGRNKGDKQLLHILDAQAPMQFPDMANVPKAYDEKLHCVLLMGATGYLGIHILSEFLALNPDVVVYCLVRASDKEHGLQRIMKQAGKYEVPIDASRITVLCGDMNRHQLGLDDEAWEMCSRSVQQIIHASAHVNHLEGYATFRKSTQGMQEIIRLASRCKIKLIHFISSIAACTLMNGSQVTIYEKEEFIEDGELVFGGYGQSKWVQETYLRRAASHGVPYVIYRFGELGGSSRTGLGQTEDMVHRLLQMRLAIGCKEKISNDVLDMLPVDFAAKLIVSACETPEVWNRILHATHPRPYPMAGVYRYAQEKGLHFDSVSRSEYLSQCQDYIHYISSANPVDGFILECVVLRELQGFMRNMRAIDGYFVVLFPFDQSNFKQSLQTMNMKIPDWKVMLDRYFERWQRDENGFMARVYGYQRWRHVEQPTTVMTPERVVDKVIEA